MTDGQFVQSIKQRYACGEGFTVLMTYGEYVRLMEMSSLKVPYEQVVKGGVSVTLDWRVVDQLIDEAERYVTRSVTKRLTA